MSSRSQDSDHKKQGFRRLSLRLIAGSLLIAALLGSVLLITRQMSSSPEQIPEQNSLRETADTSPANTPDPPGHDEHLIPESAKQEKTRAEATAESLGPLPGEASDAMEVVPEGADGGPASEAAVPAPAESSDDRTGAGSGVDVGADAGSLVPPPGGPGPALPPATGEMHASEPEPGNVKAEAPQPDTSVTSAAASADPGGTPGLHYFGDAGPVRRELVGLFVNGREVPEGLAVLVHENERLLPLRELAPYLGIEVGIEAAEVVAQTPLGLARLPLDSALQHAGDLFLAPDVFQDMLAARAHFEEADYAVYIGLSWRTGQRPGARPESAIRPQRHADQYNLSRIRGEVRVETDDHTTIESGFVEADGRLGPGAWGVRYLQDQNGSDRLEDYNWRVRRDNVAGLIGHQQIGIHPLMSGFQLTGGQLAWSNRGKQLLLANDRSFLVTDRMSPVRDFRGQGPAGGIAELQIDGRVVARQRIPLDGEFAFVGIDVPAGLRRIEVLLYEPFAATPVRVLDFSARISDQLLSPDTMLLYGGAGQEGNPLNDSLDEGDEAGFLLARYGLHPRLSLDGAWQDSGTGRLLGTGLTANLGFPGVLSAVGARDGDGDHALQARLEGTYNRWFWRSASQTQTAGYAVAGDDSAEEEEHQGEAGFRYPAGHELSVVGRHLRADGETEVSFLRPAGRVRLGPGMSAQARPDSEGDYRYDFSWQIRQSTRLSASQTPDRQGAELSHRFSSQWYSISGLQRDRISGDTGADLLLSYQQADPYGWWVDAYASVLGDSRQYVLRAGREILPGVRGRLEARRTVLSSGQSDPRGTVYVGTINVDLGRAGRRFTRAGGGRSLNTGSVGGEIAGLPAGFAGDLSDIPVRVNGQVRERTDQNGRFHIAGLAPGLYRIDLDAEGLPMEFSTEQQSYWAEVAAGAVTRVDFEISLLLGAAGRAFDVDGSHIREGRVRVVDAYGQIIETPLNKFGYYRLDGLPPGRYQLVLVDPDGTERSARILTLDDDFLFGVDLQTRSGTETAEAVPSGDDSI